MSICLTGVLFLIGSGSSVYGQSDSKNVLIVVEDSYPKGFTGYFNITDIGLLIGSPQNQNPATFSFMTFNGVNVTEQFSTAIGIGLEFPSGSYMPVVLDIRYYFRNTNFSPFLQLYGGYAVPLDDNYNQGYWYDEMISSSIPYRYEYEPYEAKGGWLLNPGFGIRSLFGENFGLVFSVGYRIQRLNYEAGDDRKRMVDSNRLSMKIGITFK